MLEHNVDGTVGGSHVCLLGICRHLDRSAWVPVVCFYQDNVLVPAFKELGVEVHLFEPFSPSVLSLGRRRGIFRVFGSVQSIVNLFRMVVIRPWAWMRVLRGLDIDAVHLNNSCAGDPDLVLAAIMLGIPVIAHQRGFPPRFGRIERLLAGRMKAIIAVSDVILEHLVDLGVPNRLVVRIHDGIELDRLRQIRQPNELRHELGLSADQLVVGMLGNVKSWKGQEVLVDAIPFIRRQFPTTCFVFVGKVADGAYKKSLDRRLLAAGMERGVVFTGYREDAIDLIALMDVVVHASVEAEPFGLVVLEAMGKGKPIVATDLGGPKETVIDGVTGALFHSGDARSLASAVCDFLADPTARLTAGKAGIAHVHNNFSAQRNAEDIEAVLSAVVGGGEAF